jgi:Ca2+-binding RTX toxin-like protein
VTGGQGNDILVGDNNPSVFIETAGRNLIIGGGGKDTLTGGSGGDILIGGRTAYDTNVAALDALLATWSRTDLSYNARVAALQSGVSYLDSTGTHSAALTPSNVFDDAASDILNGGSGQDWFFAHFGSNSDTINNEQVGEIVADI